MLIALVATNVFLLDEDICVVPAEGRPVLAELPHGDEVGGAGGEATGGAEQSVTMMLPSVVRVMMESNKYRTELTCSMQRILVS